MQPNNASDENGAGAAERLAEEVLAYVRDRLITVMPYFNRAILQMPAV